MHRISDPIWRRTRSLGGYTSELKAVVEIKMGRPIKVFSPTLDERFVAGPRWGRDPTPPL